MKRLALALLALAPFCPAETATITATTKANEVSTRTVELAAVAPNVLRLTIPVADIGPDLRYLDIHPEFAVARKGDEGYWVFPRGVYGTFRSDTGRYENPLMIPIFGMKTPARTHLALVKGMRHECRAVIEARDGVYRQSLRYLISAIEFPPYEDIVVDYVTLDGEDANYSGMGRWYRRHQLERGAVKPITERIADGQSPYLDYLCDAMPLRFTHSVKKYEPKNPVDYTPENEPPLRVLRTFDDAKPLMQAIKDAGVDRLALCVAGWQTGGYDGRCPATFPIPEELGGEAKLREYIQFVQSLGFLADGHSNFTDSFTVSPMWSETIVCKRAADGSLIRNGVWAGGKAYNLCPRNAWETFYKAEMERIGGLGFRGAHYIDVFSATFPYHCADPNHPCNRKEAGEYQAKMLQYARQHMQGAASECGWDHVIGELDYINYTSRHMLTFYRDNKKPEIVDGVVPLWEIVYHGIVLYNPDKITQGSLDATNQLRLVEFGGRPIFYGVSEKSIPDLVRAYEAYKPLRHVQRTFMESHEFLQPGIARIVYADGSVIVCNSTDQDFPYNGRTVRPLAYELW